MIMRRLTPRQRIAGAVAGLVVGSSALGAGVGVSATGGRDTVAKVRADLRTLSSRVDSYHGPATTVPTATSTTRPLATTSTRIPPPTSIPPTTQPGNVVDAPQSITADCSRAVDAELAAFLAAVPNGSTARFRKGACYAHDSTIEVRGRNDLTIDGNGATFRKRTVIAAPGVNGQNGSWRIAQGSRVTLRNAWIEGSYVPLRRGEPGSGLNYEHGVAVWGTQGFTVADVSVRNVKGDCIAVEADIFLARERFGGDYRLVPPARDGLVSNIACTGADRQGMAATAAERLTIQDSSIANVQQVGIDLEVDHFDIAMRDIKVLRNTFRDYYFSAIAMPLGQMPHVGNIEIRDNQTLTPSDTCWQAIYLGDERGEKGPFFITGNTLRTLGDGIRGIRIVGGEISGNTIIGPAPNTACYQESLGYPQGVRLVDSRDVTVRDNTLTRFWP